MISKQGRRFGECPGGDIQVPTPIVNDDMVYFNSAHGPQSPIYAIHVSAKGDLTLNEGESTNDYIRWSIPRGGAYMQTMLIYNDLLYNARWNGSVSCYNTLTGEESFWKNKAGNGNSYISSPVASDGKIYLADDQGMVYVLKAGPAYNLLAQSDLGGICMATPAITDGIIFFRTINQLIAVGNN